MIQSKEKTRICFFIGKDVQSSESILKPLNLTP